MSKEEKGKPGFSTINYKGIELDRDDVDDTTNTMNFQHIYHGGIFGTKRRHACLKNGYWCWKNAIRYPLDIRYYLKRKLRRK